MAFVHGKDSRVFLNQKIAYSDVKGWKASWKRDYADTAALGDSGAKGTPGLNEGEFEVEGFLNSAVAKPFYDGIAASVGVDNGANVSIHPSGSTIGEPAIFAQVDVEDFEVESEVGDAVAVTMSGTANGGSEFGVVQKAWGTEAASTNSTSVDNLAATANGGCAMMHYTDGTGTSMVVKIQHSTDNSTWADLITFTTVTTTPSSEFKELAVGTAVNRYTRNASTIVAGSYRYTTSFARR